MLSSLYFCARARKYFTSHLLLFMADPETGKLCAQIINFHFGTVTASIASCLLSRGRLHLLELVRITGYKPRTVAAVVLVLVQHNLLWHASTEDGEVLEVNVGECLMRLRFGRFVWQAEKLFGKQAAEIIQVILDHGKLRPPDVYSHLGIYDARAITVYSEVLQRLVSSTYLKPSTVLSHISPQDKRIQYEAEEKAKIAGFPTVKELRQAKTAAEVRLRREEEEATQIGLKPKVTGAVFDAQSSSQRPGEVTLDNSVYFRVNFDRFCIHLRDSLIAKAASERYNKGAATVLQAALKAVETTQNSVLEVRSEPIPFSKLMLQLSDSDEFMPGLILSSKRASKSAYVREYLSMLSSASNPTPVGHAGSFLSVTGSKVQVEYELVCHRLRQRALEFFTEERHGVEGVRVLRLLIETGKMDEKQISKVTMMAPKDVRPLLSSLATDSLISIQEIPKSTDRNPTRTFYLWYVDPVKAYSGILSKLYKTLYNIGVRRQAEEQVTEVKAVLEKRERSDVSQDESLLTTLERNIVKQWEEKQRRLLVLEGRVDETLFILSDLWKTG